LSMTDAKNAFHEAGHYVQGYLSRLPLCGIIMVPKNGSYVAGVETVGLQEWIDCTAGPTRLARLKDAIAVKLAGGIAQARRFGLPTMIGQDFGDRERITRFRQQIQREFPAEDQQHLMDPIAEQVQKTMQDSQVWSAVEALAQVLSEGRNVTRTEAMELL